MPTISSFYGIIITMYFFDDTRHKLPHIHTRYQDSSAVFSIHDGTLLNGNFPQNKTRLVQAWIEIRRNELLADWELAISGQKLFMIEPLH